MTVRIRRISIKTIAAVLMAAIALMIGFALSSQDGEPADILLDAAQAGPDCKDPVSRAAAIDAAYAQAGLEDFTVASVDSATLMSISEALNKHNMAGVETTSHLWVIQLAGNKTEVNPPATNTYSALVLGVDACTKEIGQVRMLGPVITPPAGFVTKTLGPTPIFNFPTQAGPPPTLSKP